MVQEIKKSIDDYSDLLSKIDKSDYVSFDVFDTLLLRNVLQPVDIFRLVEEQYQIIFGESINFFQPRIKAEADARNVSNREDILYDEIYVQLSKRLDPEVLDRCKSIELELEKNFLVANPDMKSLFDYALDNDKKVLIVSDMYLTSNFISDVLENCGFVGDYQLVVSSETNVTKATGSVYTWLEQKLKIEDMSKWLHIGDNKISDVKNAQKHGVQAYYYKRLIDREMHAIKYDNYSISYSIMTALQINYKYSQNTDNYWSDFAVTKVSSIYYGLIQWLIIQLKGQDNIYFLGRDGYIPYHIYSLLSKGNEELPKPYYIEASRRAYIYPTLIDKNIDEAIEVLVTYNGAFNQILLVKDILENVGLLASSYDSQLLKLNLDENTAISENNVDQVKGFLKEIWSDIFEQLKKEKEALLLYFEQNGMFNYKNINVFDIGWAGSTQTAIQQLINKPVTGYYFGSHENVNSSVRYNIKSYAFHLGRPLNLGQKVMDNVMMYEFIFSAPTQSLINFTIKDNKVILNRKDTLENVMVSNIIETLKDKSKLLIQEYVKYKVYMDQLTVDEALYNYNTYINQKNVTDLLMFKNITNSVAIGKSNSDQQYVSIVKIDDYLENVQHTHTLTDKNLWRSAVIVQGTDGRLFSVSEIVKIYDIKTRAYTRKLKRLFFLLVKAIKNPKKAIKKAISLLRSFL